MVKTKAAPADTEQPKSAADLVASGVCPECNESLEGKDKVAHANSHWRGTGDAAPKEGTAAYERQGALLGRED